MNRSVALLLRASFVVTSLLVFRTPARGQPPDSPLWGFADLHTHQFAHLAFGGALIAGEPYAPWATPPNETQEALDWCQYSKYLLVDGSGRLLPPAYPFGPQFLHGWGGVSDIIGRVLDGTDGHAVGGFPQFDGWPKHYSHTHQQMYWYWLERAYLGGLRLMVMHAVNNKLLCAVSNRRLGFGCDDMPSVDRQIQASKDFEAWIDANRGGWYRIAYSAAQAREIIRSGRLAVVLGIEVDDLFGCVQNPIQCDLHFIQGEIQRYYDMGVRHIFPVHVFDNAFGGAAAYSDLFNYGNAFAVGSYYQLYDCSGQGGPKEATSTTSMRSASATTSSTGSCAASSRRSRRIPPERTATGGR